MELKKLNNNKGLIKKYDEFKVKGFEYSIDFPGDIIENVIDTALLYIGCLLYTSPSPRDS